MEPNQKDYDERFKAEYYRLDSQIKELERILKDLISGRDEDYPLEEYTLMDAQLCAMKTYAYILRERSRVEGIVLD